MATTQRTADGRAGFIVAAAFFAGLAFAILTVGPAAWEPPPESSFQIDAAAVEAERPPVEVVDDLPHTAVLLAAKPHPAAGSPERLALADAPVPITAAIVAQALPTSGDGGAVHEPSRESAPTRASEADADLVPTPDPATTIAVPEAEPPPPVPEESPELRALVSRLQTSPPTVAESAEPPAAPGSAPPTSPAAPLPGEAWTDPDGSNWSDSPPEASEPRAATPVRGGRLLGRIVERRGDTRCADNSIPSPQAAAQTPRPCGPPPPSTASPACWPRAARATPPGRPP